MSKLNDFEKICKQLDHNVRAKDDMDYVKLYLVNNIHGSKDQFLKLKAESSSGDFMSYASFMLSVGAILFTMIISLIDYIQNLGLDNYTIEKVSDNLFKASMEPHSTQSILSNMIVFCVGLGLLYNIFRKLQKYTYINRWRPYVLVYLEDMEKKWIYYFPETKYSSKDNIMNPYS